MIGRIVFTVKFAENACKRLTSTLGGHKITQAILGQLCHLLWHSNSQVLGCNDSGAGMATYPSFFLFCGVRKNNCQDTLLLSFVTMKHLFVLSERTAFSVRQDCLFAWCFSLCCEKVNKK